VISGAVSPKSNGRTEEVVKRLSRRFKKFATPEIDDRNIEDILHEFQAQLPIPLTIEEMQFSNVDAQNYAAWFRNAIRLLHQAVYETLRESKEEMKRYYDKYNKVQNEPFAVGDKVLMINKRIPAFQRIRHEF